MNNEDMSDILQKLTTMINNSNNETNTNDNNSKDDVSSDSNSINEETIKNILNNLNFNNENSNSSNQDNSQSNNFNFDMNTMLKMKSMIDKINSNKNDPRSNLLMSLKPYLNNNRKEKLDQYMQFLNASKIFEAFNSEGGVKNK